MQTIQKKYVVCNAIHVEGRTDQVFIEDLTTWLLFSYSSSSRFQVSPPCRVMQDLLK
jgi:hypothetical protein